MRMLPTSPTNLSTKSRIEQTTAGEPKLTIKAQIHKKKNPIKKRFAANPKPQNPTQKITHLKICSKLKGTKGCYSGFFRMNRKGEEEESNQAKMARPNARPNAAQNG
ncbi:hypothetical protein Droror1_Dr00024205 [Drosera rotundifolia]